ncbi:hypothetical protein XENTR_v10006582 [Xenopus tropicalis]|nr:hypothetical protein XENTR_v10006582 [Xenopus tropicalis]
MAFFGLTHLGYQDPLRALSLQGNGQAAASGQTAAPKQTQRMPATSAQQYGWWLPQDPRSKAESVHPWIGCQRYPQISSPMTLFVQQMYLTDKSFRLF